MRREKGNSMNVLRWAISHKHLVLMAATLALAIVTTISMWASTPMETAQAVPNNDRGQGPPDRCPGGEPVTVTATATGTATATVTATATGIAAATPTAGPPGGPQGNQGCSIEHRANPSGKGNFGQCHQAFGGVVEGQESRELNPSPKNQGEADCRTVEGRDGSLGVAPVADCADGQEPNAEANLTFKPDRGSEARASCD